MFYFYLQDLMAFSLSFTTLLVISNQYLKLYHTNLACQEMYGIFNRNIPYAFNISDRFFCIPAATSGLFIEYTWIFFTPFAKRSII